MRLSQLQNKYLYEGLNKSETNTMFLWESAGVKLREAALTADQIQQIFTNIEQGATASGSNRTLLGKGKDAAQAVNAAWEDLKTKIQNSGPIKNVDATYDNAVAKIEAGLGGPDNAVSKMVMKYRNFAKKHPVAQSFIYAALIAAAGISGAGLGGAAVLGLLKMADKLLQGEKFSSAAYQGAKTGAMAYGASKIVDLFRSADPVAGAATGGPTVGLNPEQVDYLKNLNTQGASFIVKDNYLWAQLPDGTMQMLRAPTGTTANAMLKIAQGAAGESVDNLGQALSEGQVYLVFNRLTQLDEGVWDTIKSKAATFGKNLTTKVTADKLNRAWQSAGSPTDSEELKKFLGAQGVDAAVIDQVYADLKIKSVPAASAGGVKELSATIQKLDKKSRQRLLKYLQTQLGTA